MGILSIFQGGGAKYFDKKITPKCDYCRFGKRTKDGNKVLCEKRGLVDQNYSCGKFIYSPLKRIPVKQLNFVGSIADDEIYIESAGDRAEKEEEAKKTDDVKAPPKPAEKKETAAEQTKPENKSEEKANDVKGASDDKVSEEKNEETEKTEE